MDTQQNFGVCAVLSNSSGELLFGKRKNTYKAGWYGLPGGRVELNEQLAAAIAREVYEETGLQDLDLQYVGVIRENQGAYDFIHFVYTAQVPEFLIPQLCEPDKCEGWEWLNQAAFDDTVLAGHRAAVELFLSKKTLRDITI